MSSFSYLAYPWQATQQQPTQPSTAPTAAGVARAAGFWTQIAGSAFQAIGTYYAAKAQQGQLRSQALSLEFEKNMAAINAGVAEFEASEVRRAGELQASVTSARYTQAKARQATSAAARGVQGGSGSAAEAMASTELAKQQDVQQISANTVRAARAARMQATNQRIRGMMAGVSANNLRSSADSINPGLQTFGSILGSASNLIGPYRRR
jgi:hypothetical protein